MKRFEGKAPVKNLCMWAGLAKSSYHYKAHPGPRGLKASTHTQKAGILVDNADVVEEIRLVLSLDYCVYGYKMMTFELQGKGFLINKKKTYRLMSEHRLLSSKIIQTKGKREWVQFRRIKAEKPMEYLCLDIKHVWIEAERRWYYQLAIMDVFSRYILIWTLQASLKQTDVITMMRKLDLRYGLKGVIIRNDNGSQFLAHKVRQALKDMEARQEFTHVATPEENAYIEAFHSIQQKELFDRHPFSSYFHAKEHITQYMYWYNHRRKHGALNGLTPAQKWDQSRSCSSDGHPSAVAREDLSRPSDSIKNKQIIRRSLPALTNSPWRATFARLENMTALKVANHLTNNVQLIGG